MDKLKPLTDKEFEKLMEEEKNLIRDVNDKSWVKEAIEDMKDIISTIDEYGEEYVMSTLKAWEDFYTGIVDLTKHVLNRSKIKVVKDEEV